MKKRYWISWYQPTRDPRPIYTAGREPAVARNYWISGERFDGASTICAVVDASSEPQAKAQVRKYWPEAREWRFCEQKEAKWRPAKDRFPPYRT